MLSYCAGVSRSVYSSSLSFFTLPSWLALLQRLPGSFQFSRNFDLPSRFCYSLQTKEEVRTAALLNVQTSCNKVCINNASWNTDFFSELWENSLFFIKFYIHFPLQPPSVWPCQQGRIAKRHHREAGRINIRGSRVSGIKAMSTLVN